MLDIEGLVAGYDNRPLARLGSLHLTPGESGLLVGPSGSGKSWIIHSIIKREAILKS